MMTQIFFRLPPAFFSLSPSPSSSSVPSDAAPNVPNNWSSGVKKKTLKDESSVTLSPVNAKSPPLPVQTFLGALTAGFIALIPYKFNTTIEASLSRQTISDSYQVRQITVTIRTIINGLCYLATFVFGANAIGLLLYSGQLVFNSFMDDLDNEGEATPSSSSNSSLGDKSTEDKSSDKTE